MNSERRGQYLSPSPETVVITLNGQEVEVPQSVAASFWVQTSKKVLGARMLDLASTDTEGALNPEYLDDYVTLLTTLEESLSTGEYTWTPILAKYEKEAIENSFDDASLGVNHVKQMEYIVSQVKSAQAFVDETRKRALLS